MQKQIKKKKFLITNYLNLLLSLSLSCRFSELANKQVQSTEAV